jgi:CRISPR/Cas system-associated exonuclease Cas4 (RecB family)
MAQDDTSIADKFLGAVKIAICDRDVENRPRVGSKYYKPSSLGCERLMVFMRLGYPTDENKNTEYTNVGMADTGTRRHVAIQEVLEWMNDKDSFDWEYVSVADYVKEKRLTHLTIVGQSGMETKLRDNNLNTSFMCDGILRQKSTGRELLFEFKNTASFSYRQVDGIKDEHRNQFKCYCTSLVLKEGIIMYENRDYCELQAFHVVVDDWEKKELADMFARVEKHAKRGTIPPKPKPVNCRYCDYTQVCKDNDNKKPKPKKAGKKVVKSGKFA